MKKLATLITGGAGFLGSFIVKNLLNNHYVFASIPISIKSIN